ncbi:hypothetical protein [Paenibacillus prosopidis]|uniref:YhfM-like domain-containing protein n=1 Tax=Paenibacillus prosopidis TaxID=630520 RepID=A0A368VKK2_9BACL|nr:hypothetical protein [Paenibacillus prosopidis]RCW41951.1 hypothetical protein DFP97_12088 [Paenibacillus prosopidis]
MKKGFIVGIGVIAVLAALSLFLFRVSEDKVVVQRMVDFETAELNSQMEWTDRDAVRSFEYAVRFAKREPGTVDIAAPPYSFTLGDNSYLLWISPDYELGQFMKAGQTGTLYTVRQSLAEKLKKLLSQADSRFGKAAGTLDSEVEGSPAPSDEAFSSPDERSAAPAYLDESKFSVEERPLIHLINLRIKYLFEEDQESFIALYTESAPIDRTLAEDFPRFKITSVEVDGGIVINEQRSLFEAVVQVKESKDFGEPSSSVYVFQKGKDEDAEWLIADVD